MLLPTKIIFLVAAGITIEKLAKIIAQKLVMVKKKCGLYHVIPKVGSFMYLFSNLGAKLPKILV